MGHQIIRTASGAEYVVEWCGVATIDGLLRFYITNRSLSEIFLAFADPSNLPITYLYDGEVVEEYTDFTAFRGATEDFGGGIIVQIARAA